VGVIRSAVGERRGMKGIDRRARGHGKRHRDAVARARRLAVLRPQDPERQIDAGEILWTISAGGAKTLEAHKADRRKHGVVETNRAIHIG
jgi:hypothetical protein